MSSGSPPSSSLSPSSSEAEESTVSSSQSQSTSSSSLEETTDEGEIDEIEGKDGDLRLASRRNARRKPNGTRTAAATAQEKRRENVHFYDEGDLEAAMGHHEQHKRRNRKLRRFRPKAKGRTRERKGGTLRRSAGTVRQFFKHRTLRKTPGGSLQPSQIGVEVSPSELFAARELYDALVGEGGVTVKDRWSGFRRRHDVFVGLKMIDWIVLNSVAGDSSVRPRSESTAAGDGEDVPVVSLAPTKVHSAAVVSQPIPLSKMRSVDDRNHACAAAALLVRAELIRRDGDSVGTVRTRYLKSPNRLDDYEFWVFARRKRADMFAPLLSDATVPAVPHRLVKAGTHVKRPPGRWMGCMWWLQHVGIALFSTVMGTGGIAHLAFKLNDTFPDQIPLWLSHILFGFSAVLFAMLLLLYGLKLATFPSLCKEELSDPILGAFATAVGVDFVLMAMWSIRLNETLAIVLWIIGTTLGAGAAIYLVSRVLLKQALTHSEDQIGQLGPTIFIGVNPLALAPVAGIPLGFRQFSFMLWSTSLIFWLWLMPLVIYRLGYALHVPVKMWPTFWILLAPPSVLYNGYRALNSGGALNDGARTLFGCAAFIFCLLIAMAIRLAIRRRPVFGNTWWAFVFPSAAFATACLDYYEAERETTTAVIAIAMAIVAGGQWMIVIISSVYYATMCRLFTPAVRT
jgi:tellurite resistance protein